MRHRESVDEAIRKNALNFEFHRLSAVDRNVLRVATYELLHCPDVPPAVAINEAIEIAKNSAQEIRASSSTGYWTTSASNSAPA